jgi:phage/plasmid-associated DNA primase
VTKNRHPAGSGQGAKSDLNLPAQDTTPLAAGINVGSSWDCDSENDLQVFGRGLLPSDELVASGLPPAIHDQLAYRNVTAAEAKELTGHNLEGWVVRYCDPKGAPFQHEGKDFYRLKPLYPGKGPKYLTAKGAGCRPYWSPLFGERIPGKKREQFITEGEKKADCLNHHGLPTIGLSGVDCWKDRRSGESRPLPELAALDWNRQTYIIFDSDLSTNPDLQNSLRSLCEWIAEMAHCPLAPKVVQIPCELDGRKNGADDFIVRHGITAFRKLVSLARPAGKWIKDKTTKGESDFLFIYDWEPEPANVHYIAAPFSTVLKEDYADHPQYGVYGWRGKNWERLDHKKPLVRPVHDLLDHHEFHQRGNSRINSIVDEVSAYLRNTDWDDPNLIAFANGTLDQKTGILRKGHDQNDHLTFCFPFDYDPTATCPTWLSFVEKTYGKPDGTPDPDVVKVLRAAIRWTICPKDLSQPFPYEHYFDVGGPKGCGKGVTMETIRALCGGQHGAGTLRSKMFGEPDSMASLLNKKAAIDADASGIVTDPGSLNSIVSNEPVQIWIKYQNKCDARLGCVIWRFYNDQPRVADEGGVEGMARRGITFSIPFSVERKDPHLKSQILTELPGIYQWAMTMTEAEMAAAFRSAGEVESLCQASIDAQLDANPWLRFLLEEFPYGVQSHGARRLHRRYVDWAQQQHMKGIYSETTFGKKLKRVEGYLQTLRKRSTREGLVYDIKPMKDVDLAHFFGMKVTRGGSNHQQVEGLAANPQRLEPSAGAASGECVKGMECGGQTFDEGFKSHVLHPIEKWSGSNPPHPPHVPLTTVTERVTAAIASVGCDEDRILRWCAERDLSLSRVECRRTLKRLSSREVA